MAKEFKVTINKTGQDYSTLTAAEAALQADLTSAAVKVFSHGGITGSIADGAAVTGKTSGATGIAAHVTATQIMITGISGTFQNGEQIYSTIDVNFVVTSDAGDSVIVVFEMYDDNGKFTESNLIVNGWTTDSTNYLKITAPAGDRHSGGTLPSGAAGGGFMWETTSNAYQIRIQEHNCIVEWLGLFLNEGSSGKECLRGENPGVIFRNNIVKGVAGGHSGISLVNFFSSSEVDYAYDNIVYDFSGGSGILAAVYVTSHQVYNNTVHNCSIGFSAGTNHMLAKNNLAQSNTTDYSGTFATGTTHNLSEDTTAPGTVNYQSKVVVFVDEGADNFLLDSSDTEAVDKGTDLGTGNGREIDILGRDRDAEGDVWDLGAHELVAASPGDSPDRGIGRGIGRGIFR